MRDMGDRKQREKEEMRKKRIQVGGGKQDVSTINGNVRAVLEISQRNNTRDPLREDGTMDAAGVTERMTTPLSCDEYELHTHTHARRPNCACALCQPMCNQTASRTR